MTSERVALLVREARALSTKAGLLPLVRGAYAEVAKVCESLRHEQAVARLDTLVTRSGTTPCAQVYRKYADEMRRAGASVSTSPSPRAASSQSSTSPTSTLRA